MRRPGQYGGNDGNSVLAVQLQHYQAQHGQQQQQQGSGFNSRDSFRASEDHSHVGSPLPPYAYGDGHEGSRAHYDVQRSDPKLGSEKSAGRGPRGQTFHDNVDAGFDDSTSMQSFDGLQRKFFDDIANLSKECQEAEDAENARHRERLNEINAQYQDKLASVRAHQATFRENFLRKESQSRYEQYQQSSMSNHQNNAMLGETQRMLPYAAAAVSPAPSSVYGNQGYTNEKARVIHQDAAERPDIGNIGAGQKRGVESRGQYPGGRAYNTGGRRF